MFRILEHQMKQLGAQTRHRFVAMMATYLTEHFERLAGSMLAEERTAWVERALDKAEQHGVTTEPEAAQLILLFLVLGLDADERLAWVREVLEDVDLAAIGKVKRLIALSRDNEVSDIEQVLVYDGLED